MATTRIRLSPEARREQLLELGTQLFATRTLEEMTIDLLAEEAGISRGLLYHYFSSKQEFRRAVIERAVGELVAATAPLDLDDPIERLVGSLNAYIDYLIANRTGYESIVAAAAGGDPVIKALYDDARDQLVGRMFDTPVGAAMDSLGYADTPATRMIVLAWAGFTEQLTLAWVRDPSGLTRDRLLEVLVGGLPGMLDPTRS